MDPRSEAEARVDQDEGAPQALSRPFILASPVKSANAAVGRARAIRDALKSLYAWTKTVPAGKTKQRKALERADNAMCDFLDSIGADA